MSNRFSVLRIMLFVSLVSTVVVEWLSYLNIISLLREEWMLSFRIIICLYVIWYLMRKSTMNNGFRFFFVFICSLIVLVNCVLFEAVPEQKETVSPNKTHYIMTNEYNSFNGDITFLELYERKLIFFKVYDQTIKTKLNSKIMNDPYCSVKWLDENSLYISISHLSLNDELPLKEEYIIKYN